MSQRDLPMWARGAAAALLLVASWWLVHTETIRSAVGDSVGVLSLGVLAGSILRGMHLPLGFWPEGPWRPRMVLAVVVVVGVVGSGLLLFAWPATSQALSARVDPGTYVLVVTGVVATGIVIGLVRQRTYLRWFGVALLMAAVPYATGAVVAGAPWPLRCVQVIEAAGGSASCDASILRMIAFALPVYGAGGLLTTELAFRRMLLGRRHGAGVALVAASAVVVALWWALAAGETPSVVDTLLVGGVGGAIAGSPLRRLGLVARLGGLLGAADGGRAGRRRARRAAGRRDDVAGDPRGGGGGPAVPGAPA